MDGFRMLLNTLNMEKQVHTKASLNAIDLLDIPQVRANAPKLGIRDLS